MIKQRFSISKQESPELGDSLVKDNKLTGDNAYG